MGGSKMKASTSRFSSVSNVVAVIRRGIVQIQLLCLHFLSANGSILFGLCSILLPRRLSFYRFVTRCNRGCREFIKALWIQSTTCTGIKAERRS